MPLGPLTPTPADLATLSRLLDEALDLDPLERSTWLAALPDAHHHLLPQLTEMLGMHGSPSHADFLALGPRLSDTLSAQPEDQIGPYRLIREIGRGGMGTVWLADGNLKRQVAVKLPRLAWGEGLAKRMARERDIGALLEHPHIARLYDAGVDDLGRPYLALEYIDGQPLDVWCRSRSLSVPERLRLFLQIAHAVAYAHGRLVVHRDLKPSNVLITADGEAHLLDFGIAKLLHESAAEEAHLTQDQGRVMTPNYASPEQLRGETITVASDIYSLGVLLYELLTGSLPFDAERQKRAALDPSAIADDPPPASSRAADPSTARALKGELDAILAKALACEPARRYATADALAEDIERHLNGERVLAQPDSLAYRLRKTLRRHRIPFAAAASIGLAVIAGAIVSLLMAQRANDEAERARAVQVFVVELLKVRQSSSDTLLERSAQLIDTQFAARPALQAELFGVVSDIFHNLTNSKQAEKYAAKQLDAFERLGADERQRAQALLLLARAHVQQDHLATAESLVRRSLALASGQPRLHTQARLALVDVLTRQTRYALASAELDEIDGLLLARPGPPSVDAAAALAARVGLQTLEHSMGSATLDTLFKQAIQAAEQAEGPTSRLAVNLRLQHAYQLARWLRRHEARTEIHVAIDALQAQGSSDDIGAAVAEAHVLGEMSITDQVPPARAADIVEPTRLILLNQGNRVSPVQLALVEADLAEIHLRFGDIDRAEHFASSALTVLPAMESPSHRRALTAAASAVAASRGRHAQANTLARTSLELRRQEVGDQAWQLIPSQLLIVNNLILEGRLDEAHGLLAQLPNAVPPARQDEPDDVQKADRVRLTAVVLALERGEAAKALTLLAEEDRSRMRVVQATLQPDLLRGRALCAAGRTREGLPLFEEHLALAAAGQHASAPDIAHLRAWAGLCALDAGQRQRAQALAASARQAFARQPGVNPYYRQPLLQLEQRLQRN